tara:strand:+ start:426 stop:707 length:282 start_codon:yes stop_codon:yes gene_type:complete
MSKFGFSIEEFSEFDKDLRTLIIGNRKSLLKFCESSTTEMSLTQGLHSKMDFFKAAIEKGNLWRKFEDISKEVSMISPLRLAVVYLYSLSLHL